MILLLPCALESNIFDDFREFWAAEKKQPEEQIRPTPGQKWNIANYGRLR